MMNSVTRNMLCSAVACVILLFVVMIQTMSPWLLVLVAFVYFGSFIAILYYELVGNEE